MHSLVQIRQFQLSSLVPNRGMSLDQFADSRTVDVVNFAQVQDDCLAALLRQVSNNLAEHDIAFAQGDSAAYVEHGYVPHLPGGGLHFDRSLSAHSKSAPIKNFTRRSRKGLGFCPYHNQRTPLLEHFPEESHVLRSSVGRGWQWRVSIVRCRRPDRSSCSSAGKTEQRRGSETQREYRSHTGEQKRGRNYSSCHPRCPADEASHVSTELFGNVLGFVLGPG